MTPRLLVLVIAVVGCGEVKGSFPDATGSDAATSDATALDAAAPSCTDHMQNQGETGIDCGGPCAACVQCNTPGECPSQICEQHVCINSQDVQCVAAAPDNASSIPATVTIHFIPGQGWEQPPACAWTCDHGYCNAGTACTVARPDEKAFDPGPTGSRWFGGDDGGTIRSVGDGQAIKLTQDAHLVQFAFYFEAAFSSASTGQQYATDVTLQLRDDAGNILATTTVRADPTTYQGGWLTWDVEYDLLADKIYIFTAYVPAVFNGQNYTGYIRTDYNAGYPDAPAFSAQVATANENLGDWRYWVQDDNADYAWKLTSLSCSTTL